VDATGNRTTAGGTAHIKQHFAVVGILLSHLWLDKKANFKPAGMPGFLFFRIRFLQLAEQHQMSVRRPYPSDLSNARWQFISELIDDSSPHGRKRSTELREVVNAINYRWSTGCTWRMLPHDYPKWETVYTYFDRWRREGTLREIREIILRKSPYVPVVSEKKKSGTSLRKSDRLRNSAHEWDCNPDSTQVDHSRISDAHRFGLSSKTSGHKDIVSS